MADMKTCKACGIAKPRTNEFFHKSSKNQDGLNYRCKECVNKEVRHYYHTGSYPNPKSRVVRGMKRCLACGETKCVSDFIAFKNRRNTYQPRCRACHNIESKKWNEVNKEKRRDIAARSARKRRNDPSVRAFCSVSRRISEALQGEKNGAPTFLIVGYSKEDLRRHLEKTFTKMMSWSNYGSYWHIDHITPASSFDVRDEEQMKQCWALNNLRALPAKENISKGAKRILLL